MTLTPVQSQFLDKIERRVAANSAPGNVRLAYSSQEFENDVTQYLTLLFPHSVLTSVRLFSPHVAIDHDFGFEIDNMLHISVEEDDYVVSIEVKHQHIEPFGKQWKVVYEDREKDVLKQLDNHHRTIWEYLGPISRNTNLKLLSIVLTSSPNTPREKAVGYRGAAIYLCSIFELHLLLAKRLGLQGGNKDTVLRVSQSQFLDTLRLSVPVSELGHPELFSALSYVTRCRRALDQSLFKVFKPTPERWAINGCAGMGKSVLLAYTAAVLSSGYQLYHFQGETGVVEADDLFNGMQYIRNSVSGSIVIMAMSARQLENIRSWYQFYQNAFHDADLAGKVRFITPEFVLCRDKASFSRRKRTWTALLVDEAHDLPAYAAAEMATIQAEGTYIVIAFDPHQKLRHSGSSIRILDGFDFTNRSTRLRQIYRNPAPVYIASIALMFRWFAGNGPKVMPSDSELERLFGLRVEREDPAGSRVVVLQSDAHPANSWSHTVADFPNANIAFSTLVSAGLRRSDVLWVRFSHEDPDFDYERLTHHFTYHNCRSVEAHEICDKYIKGQDYPVVILEGFPGFMNRYETNGSASSSDEEKMWAFRRELYLCASRATCFLFFICNVDQTPEIVSIQDELRALLKYLSNPESFTRGTRRWTFKLVPSGQSRGVLDFDKSVEAYTNSRYEGSARIDAESKSNEDQEVPNEAGPSQGEAQSVLELNESQASNSIEPHAEIVIISGVQGSLPVLELPEVVTVRKLSTALGEHQLKLIVEVKRKGKIVGRDEPLTWDVVTSICSARGFNPVQSSIPSEIGSA